MLTFSTVGIFPDTILCNCPEAMRSYFIHKVSLVLPAAAVMESERSLLQSAAVNTQPASKVHFINP